MSHILSFEPALAAVCSPLRQTEQLVDDAAHIGSCQMANEQLADEHLADVCSPLQQTDAAVSSDLLPRLLSPSPEHEEIEDLFAIIDAMVELPSIPKTTMARLDGIIGQSNCSSVPEEATGYVEVASTPRAAPALSGDLHCAPEESLESAFTPRVASAWSGDLHCTPEEALEVASTPHVASALSGDLNCVHEEALEVAVNLHVASLLSGENHSAEPSAREQLTPPRKKAPNGIASRSRAREQLTPSTEGPFGSLISREQEISLDIAKQAGLIQQFRMTSEYQDSITYPPGQAIMMLTPASMMTEMADDCSFHIMTPQVLRNVEVLHGLDVSSGHEAPVIPLRTPRGMETARPAGDDLEWEIDKDSGLDNDSSSQQEWCQASRQEWCRCGHAGAWDSTGPRPCLVGHCVCDAALSLCGKLCQGLHEPPSSNPTGGDHEESSAPTQDVMHAPCKESTRRCDTAVSLAVTAQSLRIGDGIESSTLRPSPRDQVDHCRHDQQGMTRSMQQQDVHPNVAEPIPEMWLEEASHTLGTSQDENQRGVATIDSTLQRKLEVGQHTSCTMPLSARDEENLTPVLPRRILGELNCDLSISGQERRDIRGIGKEQNMYSDPICMGLVLADRSIPSPCTGSNLLQMPTPQAARYTGDRNWEFHEDPRDDKNAIQQCHLLSKPDISTEQIPSTPEREFDGPEWVPIPVEWQSRIQSL